LLGKAFWLPVATLRRRELIRFWREKAGVLGFVGSPLVFWLVVGSGFGNLAFAPLAGARLGLSQLFESTGAIFLISITFTLLGFLIAWRMDNSQGFHAVMNLLLVPL
jgi:ABC-2 type transport system permease protein